MAEKGKDVPSQFLVWMDLEMTGLDPECDSIIEIATIITDSDLNIVAEGPEIAVHHEASRFALMDAWNQEHHTKSGLWQKVLDSKISLPEAEEETLAFLKRFVGAKESPLCGNSVWQDRRFLARHMPKVDTHLHYRLIDVSTIKELSRRWYRENVKFTKEKGLHRALEDIRESVDELRFYRHKIFRTSPAILEDF
jgi:oligoribonuclease